MFFPPMAAAAAASSFATTAPHTILSCHRRCRGARTAVAARRHRHDAAVTVLGRRPPRHLPLLAARAVSDGGGSAAEANPKLSQPPLGMESSSHNINSGQGYIGLFVRMLGLDNDPLDREQAIVTLWKYSLGGKKCIDEIMQFPGCTNLVVSLLKSDSSTTCEAAAGLLRTVSSVNLYIDVISESGAIEEITGLLCQCPLASEVKEQSLCTLWNLSIDEKVRLKLANSDFVPELVKFLDDEDIKVKEAAGGILANLSINPRNHSIMVEAGVISKLCVCVCVAPSCILKSEKQFSEIVQFCVIASFTWFSVCCILRGLFPASLTILRELHFSWINIVYTQYKGFLRIFLTGKQN